MSDSKLRILKTWVARDPSLVFQCQPIGDSGFPKKSHLLIDLRQQSFGLRLQADKPADADANHAFIQILRKQLAGFTIKLVFHDPKSGDYWIPLLGGPETDRPWLIRLTGSRPPLASLVAPDDTIFVSFGQKGTFTKKHAGEARPSFEGMTDVLPKIMRELLGNTAEAEGETETEAETPSQPDVVLPKLQKDLISRLKRKQKTGKKTLEKNRGEIPSAVEVQQKEREASLLQAYAWMVKPDAFELHLDAAQSGLPEAFVIPLDPDATVGQNMEKKFAALHKAKRGRELGQKQWDITRSFLNGLEKDLADLQSEPKNDGFLQQLVRKYKLPELQSSGSSHSAEPTAKPFKTYTASTGHSILVGKGAIDNDELTKSARSNDFWLHAVGVTGSHVIVPVTADIRQSLPTQLLREAAILALHFSRVREDLAGECYVTRKQHIKKQRGMPAGLWRIDKSDSLFFRYTEDELQHLLQTVRV